MAEMKPVANEKLTLKVAALASAIKDAQRNVKQPLFIKASDNACMIAAAILLANDDTIVSFRRAS
jgi:hypothetical protein